MKKTYLFPLITIILFSVQELKSQDTLKLTFDQVIKYSEEQSPNAYIAQHRFRASYWQYRTFVAQYRPSLTLSGTTPSYSTEYNRVYNSVTKQYEYISKNLIQNLAQLSLSQNIGPTGGEISLNSNLTLENNLEENTLAKGSRNYITVPLSVRLDQPIFRYNSLKWQRKIEPIRYNAAKKTFLESIEAVHQQAVNFFFSLATAQINREIAAMNYSNADTLWEMAQGRFKLGTIAQDELLQMQLSWLNAETARKEAEMNYRDREIRLRSFLGFNENVRIKLILPTTVPDLQVDMQEVLDLARNNNPELITQQISLLTAQSSVAQAKAEKGLNANLVASYGLRDQDPAFRYAYMQSNKQQSIRLGLTVPILDWGLGRGRYKMAQSSMQLAEVQYKQALTDFEQNLMLDVEQFNLQSEQVAIAAKSDTVARTMFEVTKQRFYIGRISVLELNNADSRKDQNRRAYVQSLQNYWSYFYNMRRLALYDFINRKPLETDYEKLLE